MRLLTRDWDFAAALVEQHGVSMTLHSEFSTVYEWCAVFPEEVMRLHPSLCLFQSNALALGYRRQNRGRIEERLQQVEQAAAALEDKQLARLLIGQAATTRTVLAALTPDPAVDPREQFALAQRALAWLSEGDPARSAIALTVGYAHMALHDAVAGYQGDGRGQTNCRSSVTIISGLWRPLFTKRASPTTRGNCAARHRSARQGQADISAILAHPDQELPAVGCLDIALGCVLLEQDQLEDAEQALLQRPRSDRMGAEPLLPDDGVSGAVSPARDPGPFSRGARLPSLAWKMPGLILLSARVGSGLCTPCGQNRKIRTRWQKQLPGARFSHLHSGTMYPRPAWVLSGLRRPTIWLILSGSMPRSPSANRR